MIPTLGCTQADFDITIIIKNLLNQKSNNNKVSKFQITLGHI